MASLLGGGYRQLSQLGGQPATEQTVDRHGAAWTSRGWVFGLPLRRSWSLAVTDVGLARPGSLGIVRRSAQRCGGCG